MALDTLALERQILGSVLNDPSLYAAIEPLRAEDIQDPACAEVWVAIQSLAHSAKKIDKQAVIGSVFLASADEVEQIARTGHVDRDRLSTAVATLIDSRRTFALESELTRQIGALRTDGQWRRSVSELLATLSADYGGHRSKTAISTRQAALERLRLSAGAAIPTGLATIDNHLKGGMRGGWLIGIGAYAKTGKTTLVATISGNLDQQKVPHQLFTLERHETYIEELKAARELGINVTQLSKKIDEFEKRLSCSGAQ